jgi:sirohydrochlorin cobaltochelatase
MSAAPFLWRPDGRPDWRAMWSSFCELALFGGPPHRGPDSALGAAASGAAAPGDFDAVAEVRRGIWETTGLYSEPAGPGWLAITCESPKMAAWLCATIILENVAARCDEERLLVPADPSFALMDEVKSVITVVAKTHHYWTAHVAGDGD